ncbi:MAG: PrgH/EprH family type III secretion apparatus protein [Symbiopectobacterium sp.]|uniref:PrgH/EprH family type III secretion apparatus protein n=1 Tax=Symbiopectobacterium sp. TaxID=2952789 RepID=UPI0039E92387
MDEKYIDDDAVLNTEQFTLKILFSPMFGCELSLPADDYFFNIHPGINQHNVSIDTQEEVANMASFTCKTLYIPCDINSPNLLLHLTKELETDGTSGYLVDILNPEDSQSALIEENIVFQHKNIQLALKKHDTPWSEEILSCGWSKVDKTVSTSEIAVKGKNQ